MNDSNMAGLLNLHSLSFRDPHGRIKTAKQIYSTQFHEKATKMCLIIPHTMELVETVEFLEFLMHANHFPYLCQDRVTVLRELGILKPLRKLGNLGDEWNELEGRNRIEKLAKCSERKFLINRRST